MLNTTNREVLHTSLRESWMPWKCCWYRIVSNSALDYVVCNVILSATHQGFDQAHKVPKITDCLWLIITIQWSHHGHVNPFYNSNMENLHLDKITTSNGLTVGDIRATGQVPFNGSDLFELETNTAWF